MYEPSEQEMREAVSSLAVENYILRKKLEETLKNENEYLTRYLETADKADRLEKELEEIKQAHATPVVLA